MKSHIEQLTSKLDTIKQKALELIDISTIKTFRNDPTSGVVFVRPPYSWGTPSDSEYQMQIKLKPLYSQWIESFNIVTFNLPESLKKQISDRDSLVKDWIEKKNGWGVPSNISQAKEKFEKQIAFFYEVLVMLTQSSRKEVILIPDTNALIIEPNPKNYSTYISLDSFTMVFLPTVLSELDKLKVKSSNVDFNKKVKSVISRLKGYRQQGNLIDGITIEKTITIKMVSVEPDFNNTLTWLDRENNDDRIIASALEIQKNNPSAHIHLATGDINLQNKAEMANLSYIDIQD